MRRFFFTPQSRNEKTGPMGNTYTDGNSCPTRCPFKNSGCYAEFGGPFWTWKKASMTLSELKDKVQATTFKGQIIRHNVAGDLAIDGTSRMDLQLLADLNDVYKGRKAYTYTHCDINDDETIKAIKDSKMVINVSCETTDEVKFAREHGLNAVLAYAGKAPAKRWTEDGITYQLCQNATKGLLCIQCQQCIKRNRKTVVVFETHGRAAKKANEAIMKKNVFMMKQI